MLPVCLVNSSGTPVVHSTDQGTAGIRFGRRTNEPAARDPDSNSGVSGNDAVQVPDPDILVIGNFYQGPGTGSLCSAENKLYNFFNVKTRLEEGVVPVRHRDWSASTWHEAMRDGVRPSETAPGGTGSSDPAGWRFNHQLNAEIHELKIYDTYRNLEAIITGSQQGPEYQLVLSESANLYQTFTFDRPKDDVTDPTITDTFTPSDPINGTKTVTLGDGTEKIVVPKIVGKRVVGMAAPAEPSLLFYLPVLFVKESPPRTFLLNCGDSFKKDYYSTTDGGTNWNPSAVGRGKNLTGEYLYPESIGHGSNPLLNTVLSYNSASMLGRPFNAGLSMNVDATLINLENFCREFVAGQPLIPAAGVETFTGPYHYANQSYGYQKGNYPRIMYMTASSVLTKNHKGNSNTARLGLNIGRVNSPRAEVQYIVDNGIAGGHPPPYRPGIHGSPTSDGDPTTHIPSYVDGKFLTHVTSAIDHFYGTGSLVRRNLATLPNDNGLFKPNFGWLLSSSIIDVENNVEFSNDSWTTVSPNSDSPMSVFVDDLGILDLSLIGLQNLFDRRPGMQHDLNRGASAPSQGGFERSAYGGEGTSILTGTANWNFSNAGYENTRQSTTDAEDMYNPGAYTGEDYRDKVSPDNPDGAPIDRTLVGGTGCNYVTGTDGKPRLLDNGVVEGSYDFWVYQTTGDPSSNEVVIFDISNLFYGQKIAESSLLLKDPFMTGSRGKIGMTLRDNGEGSLYRADCITKQASWANIGNVFYNHGLGIIKSPQLAYFGKDYFEASFAGEQKLHVMTVNAFAPANAVNSSSNPGYKILSATNNANDTAPEFTYITSLNFHDDNLNVIMRANLAQPVLKRWVEEYLFKVKMDF